MLDDTVIAGHSFSYALIFASAIIEKCPIIQVLSITYCSELFPFLK